MYNRGLFHEWVPKPVQLLLILLGLPPFLVVSGVYANNIARMSGGMEAMPEFFSMANNATFIGMMAVMPIIFRLKQFIRSKILVIGGLLSMCLLSAVCYTTDSEKMIVLASLLIGLLKMSGIIEFVLPVIFTISPSLKREVFYPVFYPIAIGIGQLSAYFFAIIAYHIGWERVYLCTISYMLFLALLFVIFMHNRRGMRKVPLYQLHWVSLIIFVVILMLLNYIFTFTKYHGWFSSPEIAYLSFATVLLFAIFIYRQMTLKRPYLPLSVFTRKNVYASTLLIGLMGIFFASSGIQSTFFTGVLGYSSETNALLNLIMLPGFICSAVVSYFWFKGNGKMKGLVLMGFGSFVLSHLIFYFLFAPVVEITCFIFPFFLKGLGMGFLYISLTTYNSRNLDMQEMFSAVTIFILFRSFIGTAFFGAVFAWAFYKLRLQNGIDLVNGMDATDSFGLIRGGGMQLYGAVQIQAILLAAKQLFGYIIVAGIACLIYVLQHRFEPLHHRRVVLMSKRLRGEDISGYKLQSAMAEAIPMVV